MAYLEWQRGPFSITDNPERLDIDAIHQYLTRSFWAEGISRELVARSVANSLCLGLFRESAQIGLARVITDRATFAYLCDVYVLEEHRAQGLGKWLIEAVMAHPDLQGLRRFQLVTKDAHSLYTRFGFAEPANPDRQMEMFRHGMYVDGSRT